MKSQPERWFCYIYDNLCIGGIQTYIYQAVKRLISENHRVVVVKDSRYPIDPSFQSTFSDDKVVCFELSSAFENVVKFVQEKSIEDLTIISFRIIDLALAEKMRREVDTGRVDVFYYVPNFRGAAYYLEEPFWGFSKKLVQKRIGEIIRKVSTNGMIRYFSPRHVDVMCEKYRYSVDGEFANNAVPNVEEAGFFDCDERRRVYRGQHFVLLTVSRFDFPHKGFVIGLIKAYGRLKEKYPDLIYNIVGYGAGLTEILEEIKQLPLYAQNDIHLFDKCSPEELTNFYSQASLNISLAGCCTLGAKQGTLSVPARHFTYECEVYDFLPENAHMITSDLPGNPVEPLIESVIQMSEEEYITRCRNGYEAFHNSKVYTSFSDRNVTGNAAISCEEIQYIEKMQKPIQHMVRINGYIDFIKKRGIILPIIRHFRGKRTKNETIRNI